MKKLIIPVLMLFVCVISNSQVPQGFNYQAIARDETGQPIINTAIPVLLTIQSDSLGGTIFWQELHSAIITNDLGLFTLIVGKGTKQSGTATTFDEIDWTVTPKFIMTEVDYGGWMTMGSSRLWAVPYSLVAKDLSGSVNKLTVEGETADMEEALFEVRNKNGQTVFAVYNEGVRIYVDDGDAKGLKGGFAIGGLNPAKDTPQDLFIVSPDSIRAYIYDDPLTKPIKGGFAIGGFNNAKGITNDYLLISPDSIRAYIDTDPAKALKGGFAIGGINTAKAGTEEYLRVTRDSTRVYINDLPAKGLKGGFAIGGINTAKGNARYFDVALDTSSIINPSQNRINWYPKKNAFLTGRILIETPDSVGENSFASGYESKSIGGWSQALGYKAIARGDYSTAIGKNAVANEINSFAFGEDAKAKNDESYAIGRGAIANGYRSFAFGSAGVDSIGNDTDVARALGDYSFALGQGSVTMSHGAFALGVEDSSSADFSFAMGYRAVASGYGSFSVGFNTKSSAPFSIALGSRGIASGTGSFSVGTSNTASGHESVAMGFVSSAKNEYAFVMGDYSEATGRNSFSVGHRTSARGNCSAAFNNSCIAIGNSSSAFGANSISVGGGSFATGISSKATSLACFVIGQYNDTTSISQNTWIDTDPIFIVGNGTSELNRKNVYTIYKNGNVYMKGNLGIGITPTHLIHLSGGAYSNGVTWTNVSDQNLKENFEIVDSEVILHMIEELPITRWNYKSENSSIKHIGPVAQDFYTIFGLGTDDKSISTVDPSGIALVAIKQLSKENKSLKEQVESYRSQLQLLQQEVEQIKALLDLNNLR